ncbi:MAG: hypothetical protein ACI4XE_10005 [Acutalibacteraceae bacterium]
MGKKKISKKATVGIIVTVFIVIALSVAAVVISAIKAHDNQDSKENAEETTASVSPADYSHEDNTEELQKYVNKQYAPVMITYRQLIRHDFYRGSENTDEYEQYEEYIDRRLFDEMQNYDEDGDIYYALYDFDSNGTPELFIGTKEESDYRLFDVFTYANGQIYKIADEFEGIEYFSYVVYPTGRVMLTSYEDGDPDAGETTGFYTFYKITGDSHTFDVDGSFRIDSSDSGNRYYECSASGKETEIDKDEFDSLYDDYAGEALRDFQYDCARIDLDWKLLKAEDEDDDAETEKTTVKKTEKATTEKTGKTTDEILDTTAKASALTRKEAKEKVLDYYNSNFSENGEYVIFDDEIYEDDIGYIFTVRLQSNDATKYTGANLLVGDAFVNKTTGELIVDTDQQTQQPQDNETTETPCNVKDGELLTVSGTISYESYEVNSGNRGTVMILNLAEPLKCVLNSDDGSFTDYECMVDSVQVNTDVQLSENERVQVTGTVMFANTAHHLRDIVLVDCQVINY